MELYLTLFFISILGNTPLSNDGYLIYQTFLNLILLKEINNRIKILNEQIEQLEYSDKQNKDISKQLKNIEKIIYKEEQPIKEFNDVKFENLVKKIVIGEKDTNVMLILIL